MSIVGYYWLLKNLDKLMFYDPNEFIAIDPYRDAIVASSCDEEDFDAQLNEYRPSERLRMFVTHTALWIVESSNELH